MPNRKAAVSGCCDSMFDITKKIKIHEIHETYVLLLPTHLSHLCLFPPIMSLYTARFASGAPVYHRDKISLFVSS